MKLDFGQLKRMGDRFYEQFKVDGDTSSHIDKGNMVYSITFDPSTGAAQVHVQWPYFRDLVANEGDYPATYSRVQLSSKEEPWLSWSCEVTGVRIVTCMMKSDVVKELEALELPCDYEDDIEHLFKLWRDATGWDR